MQVQSNTQINHNTNKCPPSFAGRLVAVAKPVINGIEKEIEIYRVGKKDASFLQKILSEIDVEKLMPSMKDRPNLQIWTKLISQAAEDIGKYAKQKAYIAVSEQKPCGIVIVNNNRKQSTLGILASIPTGRDELTKGTGSSLITTVLDLAKSKKISQITLEPLLKGPTNCVEFYKKHNFNFVDPYASAMRIYLQDIKKTLEKNITDSNYKKLKKSKERNLENYLNT